MKEQLERLEKSDELSRLRVEQEADRAELEGYRLPIGDGRCVVQCRKGEKADDIETVYVETAGPGADNTTRLGTLQVSVGMLIHGPVPRVAIPSPDGRSVLVTYRTEGAVYGAVVNAEGKVLMKIPID